jgi:hydrogenase-4 component F
MLSLFIGVPLAFALICLLVRGNPRLSLFLMLLGTVATAVVGLMLVARVAGAGPIAALGGQLYLDALSGLHVGILSAVFLVAAVFAQNYFAVELERKTIEARSFANFTALWMLSLSAMSAALVANNMILLWAGIEATTVFTAFLIFLHPSRENFEAMWKYLLICGVGVSFALVGMVFLLVAAERAGIRFEDAVLLTSFATQRAGLDPFLVRAGFVLIFVGFGTKAGIFPMHTWLPDAHSKAPAPVSALFSGFMLSLALYGVMRFLPVCCRQSPAFTSSLLLVLGLSSLVVAALFIAFQTDLKRLLAYSSIEHIGIMCLSLGLGSVGYFAALFHTMNHSACKTFAFMSAGRVGQLHGTYDMGSIRNLLKSSWWGRALFIALIALIGMAPFSIFMSKFQVLKAIVSTSSWTSLLVFVGATVFVFIEVLRYLMTMVGAGDTAQPEGGTGEIVRARTPVVDGLIIVSMLVIISTIGVWMPAKVTSLMRQAVDVLSGVK